MPMKKKRDTAYYGGRSSIVLTQETRGAPYKWVSMAIGCTYLFFGLRNVFFCGAKLPIGAGEDIVMDIWKDCQEDQVKTIFGGLHGLGDWLIAIVRFSMAMTASTADLFFTMLLLGLYSTGFLVACLRAGIGGVPCCCPPACLQKQKVGRAIQPCARPRGARVHNKSRQIKNTNISSRNNT